MLCEFAADIACSYYNSKKIGEICKESINLPHTAYSARRGSSAPNFSLLEKIDILLTNQVLCGTMYIKEAKYIEYRRLEITD